MSGPKRGSQVKEGTRARSYWYLFLAPESDSPPSSLECPMSFVYLIDSQDPGIPPAVISTKGKTEGLSNVVVKARLGLS